MGWILTTLGEALVGFAEDVGRKNGQSRRRSRTETEW